MAHKGRQGQGKKAHPLVASFGAADPALQPGVRFSGAFTQRLWDKTTKQIGAGYFDRGFLRLFDDGLAQLDACLDAWSFLVPPEKDRIILGYNAYGTILVLEKANSPKALVHVLDPFRVDYWTSPDLWFDAVINHVLPNRLLPHFFDDALYRSWMGEDDRLVDGHILAAKKPEPLGGKMVKSNFQEEEIVDYYQTTGPLYATAFKTKKKR